MTGPITALHARNAIAFGGCLLLGLSMRAEQVAHASGPVCGVWAAAELVEIRRVEGKGDIQAQQWPAHLTLEVSGVPEAMISLDDDALPSEQILVILEEGP